jgi:hypothetical protein
MKVNVGGIDKILRIAVGVVLVAVAALGMAPWWIGLIGLVPLATGLLGWCPAYSLFGMNTCPMKDKE